MATTTSNLGLTLPTGAENVSRQIINSNMQAIDDAFANLKNVTNDLTKVSSAISNVEKAVYVRYGNVVVIRVTFTTSSDINTYTETLFSGAPKAVTPIRSHLIQSNLRNSGHVIRVEVDTGGNLKNAYTQGGIPASQYEGEIVYICTDD